MIYSDPVQGRMMLVVIFIYIFFVVSFFLLSCFVFVCFVVAMSNLVHDVKGIHGLC